MTLEGRCHCGACSVRLARAPNSVTQCNCSLCRATGWRGIYFRPDEVEVSGDFDTYVRNDLDQVFLRTFRCSNCGMTTHWEPVTDPPHERMGVNANVLDPAAIDGLPVRHIDGASW
ncbi:MAG TPA: GFA family protein [Sphingomicrobium sp.]|nr:GFA family protein [Sphingomicrobium sp.]